MSGTDASVKVIRIGLGELVVNWGTYNGHPAVFLEPVAGTPGKVGADVRSAEEPQLKKDSVSPGGIVIEIHNELGADVLIEDLCQAKFLCVTDPPEEPKCGDCIVVRGKSVCTMNCGPAVQPAGAK